MDADVIAQGLTFGSVYALVAMGFNVIYRPTNVFNFAQGDLVMLGGMFGWLALTEAGLPWPVGAAVVAAAVAFLALVEERLAVTPVLRRSATSVSWIITTLAVSLIIVNIVGRIWNADPRPVAPPAPLSHERFQVLGASLTTYRVALVVATVALVVAVERFYRTRTGQAILAVAEDREAALLRGIDPIKLTRWSFALGGALAGLTGLLAAPLVFAAITIGPLLLAKGFMAAAAGGVGDNRGALLAGWIIGVVEALGARLLAPGYQLTVTFVVLLAILMVRPYGLFGQPEARRV